MNYKEFTHITLNNKLFSKEEILEIEISAESHLNEVLLFLKFWFDESEEMEVQTSGSTGKPKLITISKQSFVESAKNTCDYLKLDSKTKALLCIPVTYIGGKMMVIRALFSGYNLFVQEPSANPLEELKEEIDFIAITTYQAYYIGEKSAKELKKIKNVIIGGGKINDFFVEVVSKHKNNIYSTFGMTETVSHIGLKKLNGKDKSDFFTVFPAYKISENAENCLVIDCPTLSKYKIITNDIVEIVSEQEFKWLGRKDNIINSGGIKIYPEEIEEKLVPFLLGRNYYITYLPDEQLGNKLILKIKKNSLINEEVDLIFINSKLEKHKTIKEIIYVNDFEYTETEKIIRS